jgi:hypothetical protein
LMNQKLAWKKQKNNVEVLIVKGKSCAVELTDEGDKNECKMLLMIILQSR